MTTINTKGLAPFELRKWQKKAIIDPQYAAEHPFQFYVKQIEGRFYVSSNVAE